MFERPSSRERRCFALVYLAAFAGCATAQQPDLPNGELPMRAGGGSSGVSGSPTTSGGSPGAGSPEAGNPAGSKGGAVGASGAASLAGSANNAGGHTGGVATSGGSVGTSGGKAGSAGSPASAGGPAAGTLLFSDDFETGMAGTWVNAGGTWAIVTDGSKVYAQQATGTGSTLLTSSNGMPTWTNQSVQARVKVLAFGGQGASYFAAIYARYSNTGYYALTLRSDGRVAIRKGNSTIGNPAPAGIVAGTWYTVRFDVIGPTLNAYVDGVLKATETDSTIAAGGIALSAVNATAEFDDVKVTAP